MTACRCAPGSRCGRCDVVRPEDIGTVVAQKPLTSSACDQCGRECAVGMQHSVKVHGRWVQWRECPACYLEQEKRAMAAIAVAEMAGA